MIKKDNVSFGMNTDGMQVRLDQIVQGFDIQYDFHRKVIISYLSLAEKTYVRYVTLDMIYAKLIQ